MRVLSPAGIDLVRAEVVGTGLFDESREVPPERLPDAGSECIPDLGLTFGTVIELATDRGLVRVSWWMEEGPTECFVPSPARDALDRLVERLDSLENWLPAGAWADATLRPYAPERFRLITIAQPWEAAFGTQPEVSAVEWPLAGALSTYGAPMPAAPWPHWTVRCGVVSAPGAASVTDALTDGGAAVSASTPKGFASAALLRDRSNESAVAVVMVVLRPDQVECDDAELRFLNCWAVGGVQPFYCVAP